jgi:hypothetical protein
LASLKWTLLISVCGIASWAIGQKVSCCGTWRFIMVIKIPSTGSYLEP